MHFVFPINIEKKIYIITMEQFLHRISIEDYFFIEVALALLLLYVARILELGNIKWNELRFALVQNLHLLRVFLHEKHLF